VGSYPGFALSVAARGSICCAAFNWNTETDHFRFEVLDISNPASIRRLGFLDSIGGYDIHLDRSLAYVSGFYVDFEFAIVSLADSSHPTLLGACTTPGWNFGVWADSLRAKAFVADHWEGLEVTSTADLSIPVLDTTVLPAHAAQDVAVSGSTLCIAWNMAGVGVLDVADPRRPHQVSALDTAGQLPNTQAVTLRDSFGYTAWPTFPTMRSIDLTDRLRPAFAGGCNAGNPMDIVLLDSVAYVAAARLFSVVNVARPREPRLVGSCVLPDESGGMALCDTLALVPNAPTQVVNIANPAQPVVIAEIDRYAWNVAVKDTLAFFAGGNGLFTYSIANVHAPYLIDSTAWGANVFDVIVVDTLAYVGCRDGLRLLSVADPSSPRLLGYYATPYLVWRMTYAQPYVYAACAEAGVVVFETTQTGIAEPAVEPSILSRTVYLEPNPTRGLTRVVFGAGTLDATCVSIVDVAGRDVTPEKAVSRHAGEIVIDAEALGRGVYYVRVESPERAQFVKLVKN
jgi:hypothetical protein